MLVDYSDLENDITNAPEPKMLPKGSEVEARIISVRDGVSDSNGAHWHMPVFDIPSDPLVMEFSDFLWDLLDKEKIGEKSYLRTLRRFKEFAAAFDIDYSRPFDWEDLVGKTGWIIVGVRHSDDYGDQNTVSKYVSGH